MEKRTVKYLVKIYSYSKQNIWKLWIYDTVGIIYECIEPLLLGLAIDGLMKKQYISLMCFAGVFLTNIIIAYFNDVQDDIVYNEIKHKFKTDYFSTAVRQNTDTGIIDADTELIEEPINFVRCLAVNMGNIVCMIFTPLLYMCFKIDIWLGLFSLLGCCAFTIVGVIFNKKELPTIEQIFKLNERRRDKIGSRDVKAYSLFLRKRHKLIVENSRVDARGNIWVNLILMLIMVLSLLMLSNKVDITLGSLYAGIEYIAMLISGFSIIPDVHYDYKVTEICVNRIDNEEL